MRTPALPVGIALLVALLVPAAAVPSGGPGTERAAVAIVRLAPLQVGGAGFAPGKLVRVEATWRSGHVAAVVVAGEAGRFTARFRVSVRAFVCRGLRISASQAGGPRASTAPSAKSCGAIVAPVS